MQPISSVIKRLLIGIALKGKNMDDIGEKLSYLHFKNVIDNNELECLLKISGEKLTNTAK